MAARLVSDRAASHANSLRARLWSAAPVRPWGLVVQPDVSASGVSRWRSVRATRWGHSDEAIVRLTVGIEAVARKHLHIRGLSL